MGSCACATITTTGCRKARQGVKITKLSKKINFEPVSNDNSRSRKGSIESAITDFEDH